MRARVRACVCMYVYIYVYIYMYVYMYVFYVGIVVKIVGMTDNLINLPWNYVLQRGFTLHKVNTS